MFRQSTVLQEAETTDSEALYEYITGPLQGSIGEEYASPYGQGRMAQAAK